MTLLHFLHDPISLPKRSFSTSYNSPLHLSQNSTTPTRAALRNRLHNCRLTKRVQWLNRKYIRHTSPPNPTNKHRIMLRWTRTCWLKNTNTNFTENGNNTANKIFQDEQGRRGSTLSTNLIPCQISNFIVMCKLKVGSPFQSVLWIFNKGCAKQFAGVLFWTIYKNR